MNFVELGEIAQAADREAAGLRAHKVAILGSHSTQYLNKALALAGKVAGFDFDIWEAEYDSIEPTVLDETSALYEFAPDTIVLGYSARKLSAHFYGLPAAERTQFSQAFCERVTDLIRILGARLRSQILIVNLESFNDNVFGNFSGKTRLSFANQLKRINTGLMDIAEAHRNVFVLDLNSLYAAKGRDYAVSPKLYVAADLQFSLDFTIDIAAELVRVIGAFAGAARKCLILDLDNTLWGGVIGDDGIDRIEVGSLGIGKAFSDVQRWAKQLRDRGIIVAVCSKNEEAVAKEPFERHPEMMLRLDDVAVFMANWDNKADNIVAIRETLNIGLDSIVFVDDNPAERALVRSYLPDVTVPELPDDPAEYADFLRGLNLFETTSYTDADAGRTADYQREAQRVELKRRIQDLGEYLESLKMAADVRPLGPADVARVAQLSQRSNQFNLRTVRYTESDLERIAADQAYITLVLNLADRFGDYGLVSFVIAHRQGADAVFIENWAMSCRVLKRGVEDLLLNRLAAAACGKDASRLVGEYVPTAKNKLVENHYRSLGFQPDGGRWILDLPGFAPRDTKIQ